MGLRAQSPPLLSNKAAPASAQVIDKTTEACPKPAKQEAKAVEGLEGLQDHGYKVISKDNFLKRLPKNVVKNGQLVPVRDDIGALLQPPPPDGGAPGAVERTVLETTAYAQRGRGEAGPQASPAPASERDITTIQVWRAAAGGGGERGSGPGRGRRAGGDEGQRGDAAWGGRGRPPVGGRALFHNSAASPPPLPYPPTAYAHSDTSLGPHQGCSRRKGTSEAAPEAVKQAVGGGCQSGWGRLLSVTNAVEAGTWRQGHSGWA